MVEPGAQGSNHCDAGARDARQEGEALRRANKERLEKREVVDGLEGSLLLGAVGAAWRYTQTLLLAGKQHRAVAAEQCSDQHRRGEELLERLLQEEAKQADG